MLRSKRLPFNIYATAPPDACYDLLMIAPTIDGDLVQKTRLLLDLHRLRVVNSMKFTSEHAAFPCFCFQIIGSPKLSLRAALLEMSHQYKVDWILQPIEGTTIRLVAFDMDATLIRQETLDELAKKAGVYDQMAAITKAAMAGEIDFQKSLTSRVALLKGLEYDHVESSAQHMNITEGAHALLHAIKDSGAKIVIISGGFSGFAEHLQKQLPIDAIYTNHFKVSHGKLTGHIHGEIIDAANKARILQKIITQEGLRENQVAAVGDGANDIPMLQKAGLGIAYHAKSIVQQQTRYHMHYGNLDALLYPLGLCQKTPYIIHKPQ